MGTTVSVVSNIFDVEAAASVRWRNLRYPASDDRPRGLRVRLDRQAGLIAALTAEDSEAAARRLQAVAESLQRGPLALWFGRDAHDSAGVGVDVWQRAFSGSRARFQNARLAGFLRSSATFAQADGFVAAYAAEPVADLQSWLPSALVAMARFRSASTPSRTPLAVSFGLDDRYWPMLAEFSAGAGHEINNPLGAIAGQAELLLPGESDPARRAALRRIREQVARIQGMIKDLHLVGRRKVPPPALVALPPIVEAAVAKAHARRFTGDTTVGPCDATASAFGRAAELERIAYELLCNAHEAAGPHGRVQITVRQIGRNVILTVTDDGPGFDAEALRFGLTPFFSGRSAGRGLGMGLAVVKRLAIDHGGRLSVAPGRPTRVSVTLPLADAQTQKRAA